jgi:pimeloyl-ACP methyl ester carboxylesterase
VLAPEVRELTGYRIEPQALETIGAAVHELKSKTGDTQIGLFGISFGGGLSVVAAETPEIRENIAFVLSVGGHGDLTRVSDFFLGEGAFDEKGRPFAGHPHEYGAMVLAYRCSERLFPTGEGTVAGEAILHWLREEQTLARAKAATLSPESQARLERLFLGQFEGERKALEAEVAGATALSWGTSPSRHVEALRAPIFLLHGAGDNVVPPTEAVHLASEVPHGLVGDLLVTDLVRHAEMAEAPGALDKLRLLLFMTRVLAAADGATSL